MHFQIFVPNQTEVSSTLEQVGLAHLASEFDARLCQGPQQENGALFAWLSPGQPQWGFRPEEQTWTPAAADGELKTGRYYVGLWKDAPPTPTDLARRYQHPGFSLQLGDGHSWLIPRASELPHDIILQDDGSEKYEPQRRFHEFFLEVDRWEKVMAESNDDTIVPYPDLRKFACRALALNYRITPEVVSELRLLSTSNVNKPMFAVVGALAKS